MTTESAGEVRIVLVLDHDFNHGRNDAGFHETVLGLAYESNVHTGDIVDLKQDDLVVRGRVRCLVAVVEELP